MYLKLVKYLCQPSKARNLTLCEFLFIFSVDLCKEVMDGLRTLFDFLLPTNLLYGPEKEQYKKLVITSYVQDHVKVPSK